MKKTKSITIGRLNLSAEGYEKFVSLPQSEQLEQVYNSLSPKDYVQAEKALKGTPNGDNISSGMAKESKSDKRSRSTSGTGTDSGEGREPSTEKSQD